MAAVDPGSAVPPTPRSGRTDVQRTIDGPAPERVHSGPAHRVPVHHMVVLDTPLPLGPVMHRFRAMFDSASRARRCAVFDVVVPATRLSAHERRAVGAATGSGGTDEAAEVRAARRRRDRMVEEFGNVGLPIGESSIGPADVARATDEAFDEHGHVDTVVVLTEPLGMSRWLRLDAPSRIARSVDAPVVTIEVDPTVI